MPTKTKTTANGWIPGMTWLPLSERWENLVADDPILRATRIVSRGSGKGITVIHGVNESQREALVSLFKKLVDTESGDRKAWARAAVRRIAVDAPAWTVGITALRSDGWPIREKAPAEKPAVVVQTTAVEKPKRQASANPRTQARQMVNRVIKRAQETKAIRNATPDEQAQFEAVATAGDRAQETPVKAPTTPGQPRKPRARKPGTTKANQ